MNSGTTFTACASQLRTVSFFQSIMLLGTVTAQSSMTVLGHDLHDHFRAWGGGGGEGPVATGVGMDNASVPFPLEMLRSAVLVPQFAAHRGARMYRRAARLQAAVLQQQHHHHRLGLPPMPTLAAASPSPPLCIFTRPARRPPVALHWRRSLLPAAAQVRLDRSRCKAPAVGQVATMMTDMDFSTQAKTGLAKIFWGSCRREAYASLYHPFVVSLAAGTLPKHAFQSYMAQDAYFLEAFKTAYQMAMESTEDEDAKATIDSLKRDVQEELTLHSSVMESLDVTDQSCFEPNTATVAYCDFLRAAATGSNQTQKLASTSAKIIAAMTPCMRLYAFLGQEIKKHINGVSDHPYQQWINTYSAADFEAAASKVEQLLDKLTETVNREDEKTLLYNLYRRAMNLEIDFFSSQLLGPVHVPFFKCISAPENRLLLVSDFDSTCTISDSCPVLADLTVQIAGNIPGGRSAVETGASLLRNKWDDLVMRYMDEYEEVLNRSLSNKYGSGKAFTAEELQEFLRELSDFEQKANARVVEAAVLKGLSQAAIQDAGKFMPLREGCSDFFKRLGAQELIVDTHILSVCWSKTFIEAVLEQGKIHVANITANELIFDGNISSGKITFNVETALDKQRHFVRILDHLKGRKTTDPEHQRVHSVYIGDSLTDILCLLRADVGIILGDSSTLKQVYGEKMTSLFSKALVLEQGNKQSSQRLSGNVFTVSSWYEVEAFLLGSGRSRAL